MPTYTTAPAEDGAIFAGVWVGGGFLLVLTGGAGQDWAGFRFTTLPRQSNTDTGVAGFTMSLHQPTTILQTASFRVWADSAGVVTLDAYFVPEQNPAAYASPGLEPGSRSEVLLGTANTTAGVPGYVSIPLDVTTIEATRRAGTNFQGNLAISVQASGAVNLNPAEAVAGNPPQLVTTEHVIEGGNVGHKWIGSRILQDAKTGEWMSEDEAVEDGYLRGRLVRAENWDPPDDTPSRLRGRERRKRLRH